MAGGEHPDRAAPLYQTELALTPLPDILVTIHRYRVPGVIECRRGDESKRVYLDDGRIIFATTNQVTESLGDRLIREGRLSQLQYEESVRVMKVTGMRHGVTLINMGLLTREELFVTVRAQLQEIIDSLFEWTSGTVAFTPGRDKEKALEFVRLDLSVPDALTRGVRRAPDARALVARLGSKSTLYERTGIVIPDLTLRPDEEQLLALVDGRRTLHDLVMSTAHSTLNARLLYAFLALGLIVKREPARPLKVQIRTEGPHS